MNDGTDTLTGTRIKNLPNLRTTYDLAKIAKNRKGESQI